MERLSVSYPKPKKHVQTHVLFLYFCFSSFFSSRYSLFHENAYSKIKITTPIPNRTAAGIRKTSIFISQTKFKKFLLCSSQELLSVMMADGSNPCQQDGNQ